jgi:2-polyprenyl-3-methyl-5-hydroxy-6-metoxy-1,4-benzoquinol methylase
MVGTMKDTKEFYEDYWRKREQERRLHTIEGFWLPNRITIALRMVQEGQPAAEGLLGLLDIGCGEGALGKLLRESSVKKFHLVGVDISETAVKHAEKYYDKAICANVESENLAKLVGYELFDYIICLETLEHLFEPEKLLQQFAKLIKPEGYLIASFPNIAWWKYRLDLLRGKFPQGYVLSHPSEHIQNFTLTSFYELLRENGFEPVMLDGKFVPPRILRPRRFFVRILRWLPNLFGYQLVVLARLKQDLRRET